MTTALHGIHALPGGAPAAPLSIMTVLGGRVTTNVEMLPRALRLNRPTRAEANIAAEVIEQLYAEVCAARRAGFSMPQKPDEAALHEDDFALSRGRRIDVQASLSATTRTLLEKVYERLCKAQMFDLATEVRRTLEASAATSPEDTAGAP